MAQNDKVWAWVMLLLLSISSVAAIEDFTATGTARILGTACSPADGEVIVTNIGDVPSAYELIAEGDAKDWVLFVPEAFTLNPGQSMTIQEFFAIPCDAEDQFLDVTIATADLELALTQDIIVQPPNNLVLVPQVYSQTVLPCDPADYSFVLHNPADFAETYSLKVIDSPETVSLSDDKITLPPGTNETIAVTINPKDCAMSGDFIPVLVVSTEKSRIAAELEMFLRINDSDIPEIAQGVDRIRAGFAAQEAGFEIENTGDRITTYYLSIEGPNWVSVQPEQITVDPRDSEKAKLVLQPTESTPQGKHTVTLTAEVEATGKEYTKDFTIILKKPSFADKLLAEYRPFTIGGIVVLVVLIILIFYGVRKYNSPEAQARRAERAAERERRRQERIALKEQRRKEREEEKQRKGEEKREQEEREAKEAEQRERELERERMKAQRASEKQIRRENLVIPKDSIIAGIKTTTKRFWKLALLVLVIVLVLLGIAYQDVLAKNSQAALTGIIVLLAILILHRIRRRRVARGRWKLALAGKAHVLDTRWRKGLTQLSFKLNNVVEKLTVTVRKRRPTAASPSEHTYQTFTITPNVEGDMVSEARFKFCVKRSWLLRHSITPSSVRLLQLVNDRWQSHSAEPVSTDNKHVYYVAKADSFGEFAIVGKASARKAGRESKYSLRKLGLTVFGILAVIALIALVVLLPPKTTTPTVGIPTQVWKHDTQHTLDLGQYFKDPDNDPLTFTATRTEHIDISIVGDKAVLTPEYGWSGNERAVFIADDGKGGIVKSNPTQLVVEPPVIPTSWKRYAKPVLTIAVILLIIIGAVLFRKPLKKAVGLE